MTKLTSLPTGRSWSEAPEEGLEIASECDWLATEQGLQAIRALFGHVGEPLRPEWASEDEADPVDGDPNELPPHWKAAEAAVRARHLEQGSDRWREYARNLTHTAPVASPTTWRLKVAPPRLITKTTRVNPEYRRAPWDEITPLREASNPICRLRLLEAYSKAL